MSDEEKVVTASATQSPWYIFDVYTGKGGKITCKVSDPKMFEGDFETLMAALQNTVNKHGVTLTPPPLPATPLAAATVPLTDEAGAPVTDDKGNQQTVDLPAGIHLFTVKALFHDKTKTGKDVCKVVTVEEPYNTKYGVSCFHPEGLEGWKTWPLGVDVKYAPPKGFGHVLIRDPNEENQYANVIEFRE